MAMRSLQFCDIVMHIRAPAATVDSSAWNGAAGNPMSDQWIHPLVWSEREQARQRIARLQYMVYWVIRELCVGNWLGSGVMASSRYMEERTMKYRTALVWALGLAVGSFAGSSYSKGIRIDENITCASVAISSGNPFVTLVGTGSTTNTARSGFNFPVLRCTDSVAGDSNVTSLPYQPKNSRIYTWVDLSLAGVAASSLTGPATDPNTPPLSSFQGLNVAIIAQVEVLKLKGSYLGDYEVIFNYEDFPEVACENVYTLVPPTLKWHNKTYTFTGAGGVTSPCDDSAGNDFLFSPTGVLLGHNSVADGSSFVLSPGPPPGWSVQ